MATDVLHVYLLSVFSSGTNPVYSPGASTVFTKEMGAMEVVPFFGTNLNRWLPLLLVVHCSLILSDAWRKVAAFIAPSFLQFDVLMHDDENLELGKELIRSTMVKMRCFSV